MKKLVIIFLLIPFVSFSQKVEMGWTVGTDLVSSGTVGMSYPILGIKTGLTLMTNIGNIQAGAGVELGSGTFGMGFAMPYGFVNRKFNFNRLYLYAGGMAGWIKYQSGYSWDGYSGQFASNGYSAGIQGGAVLKLGKHISMSGEIGIRRATIWYERMGPIKFDDCGCFGPCILTFEPYEEVPNRYTDYYLTSTIGIRYRF